MSTILRDGKFPGLLRRTFGLLGLGGAHLANLLDDLLGAVHVGDIFAGKIHVVAQLVVGDTRIGLCLLKRQTQALHHRVEDGHEPARP